MPQARLPDINASFLKYRSLAISSIQSENYDAMFGALYALNGDLPEKYQIRVSTIEFNLKTKQDIIAVCPSCNIQTKYETIVVLDLLVSELTATLLDTKTEKCWVCPSCKETVRLADTKFIKTVLKEPYFLQVVPKPPERKGGLMNRSAYEREIKRWGWTMLNELEHQMAEYRDANWVKKDNYYDDSEVDTEGESDQ